MVFNEQLRLTDGTIVRRCPFLATGGLTLYCSRAGKFYSVHNAVLTDQGWQLHELKANFPPAMRTPGRSCHNGIRGNLYPIMTRLSRLGTKTKACHVLIALTWIGPRPEGMEIDHLNGDILNWSADNLQYVTPKENHRRAKILRVLRSIGRDPKQLARDELLAIFNKYDFATPKE